MSDFKSMNLLPSILEALEKKGYTTPTPIQAQAIPKLLEGKDLLGIAQTGTGKTAAFSLPIINRLGKNKIRIPKGRTRVLIVTPTRELASQIEQNIEEYSIGLNLSTKVIFGGVAQGPQVRAMSRGVDILVATPGRLLDLMNQKHVMLDMVEVLVLDEADRMLDMGFVKDIKKIIARIPPVRQTLLFSATMPNDIARLASSMLKEPVRVEVTPQSTTVEKIDQVVNFVEKGNKPLLLKEILKDEEIKTVLVFSRTKHGANRVVKHLDQASIPSAAIHGNKSQGARERALNDFRAGKIRVLVATDIAARGIDVEQITHVVNYDLPDDPKSYVHRIGRTARAGRTGVAISFCDKTELKLLRGIEKLIKSSVPVDEEHIFHGVPAKKVPQPQRTNRPVGPGKLPKKELSSRQRPRRKKKPSKSRRSNGNSASAN